MAFASSASAASVHGPPVKHVSAPWAAAFVDSASMEPTIHCAVSSGTGCQGKHRDQLLEELTGSPGVRRGDIVSIRLPPAAQPYCDYKGPPVIKRVIGIGGDRVIERRGVFSVNGRVLREPYVPTHERDRRSGRWDVPTGSLFVAGDNRRISCDSRYWGPLDATRVEGRVVEIIRPSSAGADPVGPPIVHVRYPWVGDNSPWGGMQPAIHCGRPKTGCQSRHSDVVLTALSGSRSLRRGDIVMFRVPADAPAFCGHGLAYERVIGLPGERVTERTGLISIDGKRLDEPYVPQSERDRRSGAWRVGAGSFFVMADWRSRTCDSRFFGSLPASRILGPVVKVIRSG
jgi:signal peptidase I